MAKIKNKGQVHTGYGHIARKSLGQNFLKSEPALSAMCESGEVSGEDVIVEIGPGKGALTAKLLERAKKVIAIEKDHNLVALLEDKFKSEIENKKLELIKGDCLDFDPNQYSLSPSGYKLIANIPYNITGAIIKKFLSEVAQPSRMVILVQKEVAMRITANDKKESILSLSVKVYGTPKYIMKVSKRFFSPSPKVDSAIVSITGISDGNFSSSLPFIRRGSGRGELINDLPSVPSLVRRGGTQHEEMFFKVIKAGFAHKRKILKKNLEQVASPTDIKNLFEKLSIDEKTRAEDLPLQIWLGISRYLIDKM